MTDRTLEEIVRDLMDTNLGREFFRVLMTYCGTDTVTFTNSERDDIFAKGKKSVGVAIDRMARRENFNMYLKSLRESENNVKAAKGEKYESF